MRRALILIWIVALSGSLSACDPREWFVCALGLCGEELDTRPPFPPQNPRAVAFSRGVALDWTASAASDVAKYDIYRSTVSGGPRTVVASTTTTSFRDSGLSNGTEYFYAIRAVDSRDRGSTFSREVSAKPRADLAPAPPAGLTAAEVEGRVELLWAESFSATLYRVYRATASGGPYTRIAETTATAATDSGVTTGTRYFYVVTAVNADGTESAFSSEAAATPGGLAGFGFVTSWGGAGEAPGKFDGLIDVTVDRAGNVYALEDFPGWRVQKFTPAGTFVSEFQITGDFRGIAVDFQGNVYVTNTFFDVVEKYSPAGVFQMAIGDDVLVDPGDVAIHPELGLFVTDTGADRVRRFALNGASQGELGQGPGTGNGQFDAPEGIALDPALAVYVVDRGNSRIQKFNGGSGAFIAKWGAAGTANGEFGDPWGVAAGPGGVFVTDRAADRVQAFTTAGAWRSWIGGSGAGPGHFDDPAGIAVDCNGNVYVADRGNDRIQKFGGGASAPCGSFAGAFVSRAFRGSFVATKSFPGKVTAFSEKGARQQGTFNVRGVGKGRWYALFDASGDPLALTARAKGKLLALRKGRDACLTFTVDVKDGVVSGRFSGGARGSFRQSLGKTWKVTGSGSPGRSSTTACRAVRKAFRLR